MGSTLNGRPPWVVASRVSIGGVVPQLLQAQTTSIFDFSKWVVEGQIQRPSPGRTFHFFRGRGNKIGDLVGQGLET